MSLPRTPILPLFPSPDGAASGDVPRDPWASLLGPHARVWLVLGAVLVFGAGAAAPLGDPDLGMHLRVGEWIAAHGRLPVVEPFAWTRAGAPYYAYSWVAELVYYATGRAGGVAALRLLQGAIMLASGAAAWAYARAARLPRPAAVLLTLAHLVMLAACVPNLRPQGVLGIVMPLAWAAGERLGVRGGSRREPGGSVRADDVRAYALLAGAAALAANTHLLAPIVAVALAPVVGAAAEGAEGRRRLGIAAACVAGGLLLTPYAADWAALLRLNFAPNALFRFPSPVVEHTPGIVAALRPPQLAALLIVGLLLLPWASPAAPSGPAPGARVERALYVGLWLGGALLFGLAARALLVWWLLALPLVARALEPVPAPSGSAVGRWTWRLAVAGGPLMLAITSASDSRATVALEDPFGRRTFGNVAAMAAFAAADTLDRRAPGAGGRVLTTFNYGNALLWRLPRMSMSIDGRTIFPDSAAALDAYRLASDSLAVPSVVGSADLAVLPAHHAVSARIARAGGWRRLATVRTVDASGQGDTAVVWATDRWAARWVRPAPP